MSAPDAGQHEEAEALVLPGDGAFAATMDGVRERGLLPVLRERAEAGTPLLVVEAMKMEHVLTAPVAGTVTELSVTAGQSVRLDERLALVIPATTGEGE